MLRSVSERFFFQIVVGLSSGFSGIFNIHFNQIDVTRGGFSGSHKKEKVQEKYFYLEKLTRCTKSMQ
ncbi:hypothetical protein [Pantoea anthophila]|uniref:hypothetical protein n=1 Tax=Pantoea anthophila TaxID=470931 RepID=UPI00278B645B|nr:hypothetical protein [Pantoea anthophila]MDQ1210792.1 hypothetical protein [Pantoea anthophila]